MNWKLLWDLFTVYSRVALFSWGGGPASMGLMQREVVTVGWVTPEEFADSLALGNALPGPIAPQVSAYIGYKMAGLPGALSAVTGTVLPTTLLMLVMIVFFFGIKDSPQVQAMLKAVRPVVVGLLLYGLRHGLLGLQRQQGRLDAGTGPKRGQGVDRPGRLHPADPDRDQPSLAGAGRRDPGIGHLSLKRAGPSF
jgi:chromate transport protein ChrA